MRLTRSLLDLISKIDSTESALSEFLCLLTVKPQALKSRSQSKLVDCFESSRRENSLSFGKRFAFSSQNFSGLIGPFKLTNLKFKIFFQDFLILLPIITGNYLITFSLSRPYCLISNFPYFFCFLYSL